MRDEDLTAICDRTKKSEAGISTRAFHLESPSNDDYVIWANCGLEFDWKQLTLVSCQRLQNVSLSIRWENVGKKAPGSRPTRHNGLL